MIELMAVHLFDFFPTIIVEKWCSSGNNISEGSWLEWSHGSCKENICGEWQLVPVQDMSSSFPSLLTENGAMYRTCTYMYMTGHVHVCITFSTWILNNFHFFECQQSFYKNKIIFSARDAFCLSKCTGLYNWNSLHALQTYGT